MALGAIWDRLRFRRALGLVQRQAALMDSASPLEARLARQDLRRLRRNTDRAIAAADARIAAALGAEDAVLPARSDWSHRPAPWRLPSTPAGHAAPANGTDIGGGVTLHHDCPLAEITLRQDPAPEGAPFRITLDVLGFEGDFLSMAIPLPESGRAGLSKEMLYRLDLALSTERVQTIYGRLNLRHGPNVERLTRALEPGADHIDFDLFYADLEAEDVSALWLDLIFENPAMTRIRIDDLVLSRRPRAGL